MSLSIEPMRVRDLGEILKIERLSFPTPWSKNAFLSELLENDRAYYLVARLLDKPVGYIGVWIIADEGHITNVAVHPMCRGRGIGRKLLVSVSELARRKGAARLTLEVRVSNVRAQGLYKSLGFKGAGVRRGYYRDNNEDAIIMWKDIEPDGKP
ncbi:MAG: ribosomal protein S18-alanine N-acetyltransferase [Firmicutes bacterium]|nr:ribosomal protein S18-alanine N-acetyltransferase [Bacillota bacterium]